MLGVLPPRSPLRPWWGARGFHPTGCPAAPTPPRRQLFHAVQGPARREGVRNSTPGPLGEDPKRAWTLDESGRHPAFRAGFRPVFGTAPASAVGALERAQPLIAGRSARARGKLSRRGYDPCGEGPVFGGPWTPRGAASAFPRRRAEASHGAPAMASVFPRQGPPLLGARRVLRFFGPIGRGGDVTA